MVGSLFVLILVGWWLVCSIVLVSLWECVMGVSDRWFDSGSVVLDWECVEAVEVRGNSETGIGGLSKVVEFYLSGGSIVQVKCGDEAASDIRD